MTVNGIYENATGDLLRWSFGNVTAGAGETKRTDVPFPAERRFQPGATQMDRWTLPSGPWIKVAQPTPPAGEQVPEGRWVLVASGNASVAVETQVTLAQISNVDDGQVLFARVTLRDNIAGFKTYEGNTENDPPTDQARHCLGKGGTDGEHRLRIRHKRADQSALTFDYRVYTMETP